MALLQRSVKCAIFRAVPQKMTQNGGSVTTVVSSAQHAQYNAKSVVDTNRVYILAVLRGGNQKKVHKVCIVVVVVFFSTKFQMFILPSFFLAFAHRV